MATPKFFTYMEIKKINQIFISKLLLGTSILITYRHSCFNK